MRRLLASISLVLPFCASMAQAHPHVMVESATTVVFDDSGRITAVRHDWTFDEMYTSFAVQGLDKNKNGLYEREELQELANINVEGLGEFSYFTFMKHGERKVSMDEPKEPWMSHANKKMTLHFLMPLKTPFLPNGRPVTLSVYDTTYFVAFSLADGEPARLEKAPQGCAMNLDMPKARGYIPDDQVSASPETDWGKDYAGKIVVKCP